MHSQSKCTSWNLLRYRIMASAVVASFFRVVTRVMIVMCICGWWNLSCICRRWCLQIDQITKGWCNWLASWPQQSATINEKHVVRWKLQSLVINRKDSDTKKRLCEGTCWWQRSPRFSSPLGVCVWWWVFSGNHCDLKRYDLQVSSKKISTKGCQCREHHYILNMYASKPVFSELKGRTIVTHTDGKTPTQMSQCLSHA